MCVCICLGVWVACTTGHLPHHFQGVRDAIKAPCRQESAAGGAGGADEVEKLAGLFDKGLLSKEQFTLATNKALGI